MSKPAPFRPRSTAAGLTKTTAGTVILISTHGYTGDTVVTNGTLQLGNSGAIANASRLVLNGGTFATGGFDAPQR